MTNSLLTIITFVPLVGALLTLLPWGKWLKLDQAGEERLIKNGAIALSLLPLGLALMLWFGYDQALGGLSYALGRLLMLAAFAWGGWVLVRERRQLAEKGFPAGSFKE